MIAPALRLVAAVGAGAVLVGRPRSGVLHVYAGPLTPSGGFVPMSGRTVCRVRTRRLSVFKQASPLLHAGTRRVCARCEAGLPAALGVDGRRDLGVSRGEWMAAFGHLSPQLLRWAGSRCRTVAESHEVGRVATMLHGPKPRIRDPRLPAGHHRPGRLVAGSVEQQARWLMHDDLEAQRRRLVGLERPDDERAAAARQVEAEELDRKRSSKARKDEATASRLRDREIRGQYIAPWERRPAS